MGEGEVPGLTGVRHGDLADLIGVEPDLALAALEDARGETLLQLQRHHLLPPPPRGSSSPLLRRVGVVWWAARGGAREMRRPHGEGYIPGD